MQGTVVKEKFRSFLSSLGNIVLLYICVSSSGTGVNSARSVEPQSRLDVNLKKSTQVKILKNQEGI